MIPGVPYQLEQLADNQPRLSAFFALKTLSISGDAFLVKHEDESISSKGGQEEDDNSSEVGKSMEYKHQSCGGSDDNTREEVHSLIEQSSRASGCSFDVKIEDREDESIVKDDDQTSPCARFASVGGSCLDNQDTKSLPSPAAVGSSESHSTLKDPNFVENYFKVSRGCQKTFLILAKMPIMVIKCMASLGTKLLYNCTISGRCSQLVCKDLPVKLDGSPDTV